MATQLPQKDTEYHLDELQLATVCMEDYVSFAVLYPFVPLHSGNGYVTVALDGETAGW